MNICFAILAHDRPQNVVKLVRRLLEDGGIASIHYDASQGDAPIEEIRNSLGDLQHKVVWAKRVAVAWGEWSMIEATLNAVRAVFEAGHSPDYIHLLSAADYPIRPLREFRDFLSRHKGTDFIESYDVNHKKWVRGGLSRERYQYRHFFNFKKHPRLFGWNWKLQRFLGMNRKPPKGLQVHMGSQWCTLTGESWQHILKRSQSEEFGRFFKRAWIPDEMYMQTLLADAGKPHSNRHLTLYQFTDYGVPVVYYNGHAAHLAKQPFFFARKLSPHATALRDELDRMAAAPASLIKFYDDEIGTPTADYEESRLARRTGLVGKRVVGQVKDERLSDLEWNRQPYLAILGIGQEELDGVAQTLGSHPGFIAHGALFANDKIGFAGGQNRFAGYGKHDFRLRDHKRTSFLVDVISQSPGKVSAFTMHPDEEQEVFEKLLFDKRSHFLVVKGNLMRAFAGQELLRLPNQEQPHSGAPKFVAGKGRFLLFSDRYQKYYSQRIEQLTKHEARFAVVDLNNPAWRYGLGEYVDSAFGTTWAPALAAEAARLQLSNPADRLANFRELVELVPDAGLKETLLDYHPEPCLVLQGIAKDEVSWLAQLLNASGQFDIREANGNGHRHTPADAIPGYYRAGPAANASAALGANARVVNVKGNVFLAAREFLGAAQRSTAGKETSLPWCDPAEFQCAYEFLRCRPRQQGAAMQFNLDLMTAGWRKQLAGFLAGAFANRNPAELENALKDQQNAITQPGSGAPAAFSNEAFLCSLIPDESVRNAHLRALSVARTETVKPAAPVIAPSKPQKPKRPAGGHG